jgi:hypothetical protein
LIIRQPAVTGVALVKLALAAAFFRLSLKTNFAVSSIPIAGRESAIAESLCDANVRALVFLPDAYINIGVGFAAVGRLRDLLARSSFFERRSHVKRLPLRGQYHGEEALSALPAYAGEVGKRCALWQEDSGKIIVPHQLSSSFLALNSLFDSDGLGFSAQSAKRSDGWRRRLVVFTGEG